MTATDPRPVPAAMPAASRPKPPPPLAGYRMHTSVFGGFATHAPHRRPGPRAGAQPLSWRQLRRLNSFSAGRGGGASQGWTPASPLGGEDRRGPG